MQRVFWFQWKRGFSLNEGRFPNVCVMWKPWFFYLALSSKLRYPQWDR